MSKRTTLVERIDCGPDDERVGRRRITVEVNYSMGGYNNMVGRQEARGYRLSVMPEVVEKGANCSHVISKFFDGAYAMLEEASRYSERRLDLLSDTAKSFERYDELVQYVLDKKGWKRWTEEAAPTGDSK